MNPIKEQLLRHLEDELTSGDWSITEEAFDEASFGNALVALRTPGAVRVRVTSDRGQTFADVASPHAPLDWHPLERVLSVIGVPDPPSEGSLSVAKIAKLLRDNAAALERGLGVDWVSQTRPLLGDVEKFGLRQLLADAERLKREKS